MAESTPLQQRQMNVVKGASDSVVHSFSDAEKVNFCDFVNQSLGADPHLGKTLPLNTENDDLFTAVKDGILMAKLINKCVPGTIDERTINLKEKKNVFEINENQNLVLNSAKAIGCQVINVRPADLIEGKPHLVLGLMWQIIKMGLYQNISLKENPNLIRLLLEGEDLRAFMKLPPDQILLRWFNYHLARAGTTRRVSNFGHDIADSECYTILLAQIAPTQCNRDPLKETEPAARAEKMLQQAARIDCRKFVRPKDVVDGNQKLNLAFVANIYNTLPALDPPEQKMLEELNLNDLYGDESDSREERTYRVWINSLGVQPEVTNLFEDVRDGLVPLRMLDAIQPGIVSWNKVSMNPNNKFKKVENCEYAVLLGKQLKFSLVGIGGGDLNAGNKKLTLALIWQAMRFYILNFLKQMSSGGKEVSEADICKWANDKIAAAGKSSTVSPGFKDKSLSTSHFIIDLLYACDKRSIEYGYVKPGADDQEKQDNAKYAIGCARKMGCTVFCLWEDIVEVKPKMMLVLLASIMTKFGGVDQATAGVAAASIDA